MTPRPGAARTLGLIAVATVVAIVLGYAAFKPDIGGIDESRRVRHWAGFSIIVPEDWHVEQYNPPKNPYTIYALPKKAEGITGGLWAVKLSTQPKIETTGKKAMQPSEFQGKPAWTHINTSEGKKVWSRSYLFERDGTWYSVILARPASESITSRAWSAYMNSFRVEEPIPEHQPSTYTTTKPSADMVPTTIPSALPEGLPE